MRPMRDDNGRELRDNDNAEGAGWGWRRHAELFRAGWSSLKKKEFTPVDDWAYGSASFLPPVA